MESNEYVKLAEVEDRMWYFGALHRHVHRLLSAGLTGKTQPRILDAGCGTGGLILRLKAWEHSWNFTGIDFSELACKFAQERCANSEIRQASVTELPFADASFDAIVSADVICQIDQPELAVKEFARCVKPGGFLVINVPAYRWMMSYHDVTCQTKHRYVRREVAELLTAAGFTVSSNTYWNCLPFPLLVLKRKVFVSREHSSDVRAFPAPIEAVFRGLMAIERAWFRVASRLPYGSSVLCSARKR